MYPPIEPNCTGMLPVSHGNYIYWEECGNPQGRPVLVLHGGPGSGCNTGMRRLFDPDAYRIVLFDQRGCGRSIPHAANFETSLEFNTTQHLVEDIDALLNHLNIHSTVLWGGSWGCTLALAYALRNPDRILAMVLTGVTTTRQTEIDWLYKGVAPLFPEQWEAFRNCVPQEHRNGNLVETYAALLAHQDEAVRIAAASAWCTWESALISVHPDYRPSRQWQDPAFQMTFARIVTHYFRNGAWLAENELLNNAYRLNGIPGALIHGRLDLDAPLTTAWELSRVWKTAILHIVQGAGHAGTDPGLMEAVLAATDRFRR